MNTINIIDNIKTNQIQYFRSINLIVINYNITYHCDKSIVYKIIMENENIIYHISIHYNWFLNKGGISIYAEDKLFCENTTDIFNLDELNEYVIKFILNKIYK